MKPGRSVTFITSSLRLSGGVLVLMHHANGLVARGYRVTFVGSAGGADPEVREKLSPQVQVLSADLSLEEAGSLAGKVRLAWQMARLAPRSDILVATHTPTVVPTLVARHLLHRSPKTVWFYQDLVAAFEGQPIEQWLLRHAPHWFDQVVAVSNACRTELASVSGLEASVVQQGFSHLATDELPERKAPPPGYKVIMCMADRRPRKGWQDFLMAAHLLSERHPDLRLTIVTKEEGPIDAGLPGDIFVRPSWPDLVALYQSARVFVSASWVESFGRPPLEAMACGTPVVTTDSGGVRDYAQDGVNCLLVPIQDPAALAAAVDRILNDDDLARRLGEAGRQTARQFTWQRAIDAFIRVLETGR